MVAVTVPAAEGDEEREIRGPAVREEIARQAAEVNATKDVDMRAVKELLRWATAAGRVPCEGEGEERGVEWVAAELCSWKACVRAIGGFQEGKGLGIDGFDGYLVKKAEEPVWREYHRILQRIVRERAYPKEWNVWIGLLAMKPGEDAKDFARRRDLWLQPHSEKCLMRMLLSEYQRAAAVRVPGSAAGFTAQRGAPEQTLAARLRVEISMMERGLCATGYLDMGTFFMSVVNDVALNSSFENRSILYFQKKN